MKHKKLINKYYFVMGLFILSVPVIFILLNYSLLLLHYLLETVKQWVNPGLEPVSLHQGIVLSNFYLIFFSALFLLVVFGARYFKVVIQRINNMDKAVRTIANDDSFPEKLDVVKDSKDEINALSGSINRLIDRIRHKEMMLDTQSKHQREYLKQLSHDINTPLTALNLEIYQLAKEYKVSREDMEPVYQKVGYISDLVNKVTETDQFDIDNHYIFTEEISLKKQIDRALKKWQYLLDQSNITVNCTYINDVYWQGDALWFERLFDNVLSNIYKHSKTNHVDITLDTGVEIKDYGIGFQIKETESSGSGIHVIYSICNRFSINVDVISSNKGTIYHFVQFNE